MVAIFISMFTNNWLIGTWDGESSYFGLHEESWTFEGDTYILDYSFQMNVKRLNLALISMKMVVRMDLKMKMMTMTQQVRQHLSCCWLVYLS